MPLLTDQGYVVTVSLGRVTHRLTFCWAVRGLERLAHFDLALPHGARGQLCAIDS